MEVKQIWEKGALDEEKGKREGARPYEALAEYLNLGPQRSQAKVAKRLGKSETLVHKWAYQWDWARRTDAYDHHMAKIAQDGLEDDLRGNRSEWLRRWQACDDDDTKIADAMLEICRNYLDLAKDVGPGAKRMPVTGEEVLVLGLPATTLAQVTAMAKTASEMRRRAVQSGMSLHGINADNIWGDGEAPRPDGGVEGKSPILVEFKKPEPAEAREAAT